jgi:hypothetical protein
MTKPALRSLTLDELEIDDERSFRHVALYADLKEILRRDSYRVRVLPEALAGRWDRALFLNLTFWGAGAEDAGDVLDGTVIPADVVAHMAWHHLCARAVGPGAPSVNALFLGEAIASAFDLYLVGRLLGHSPDSSFLATQVPAMAEAAQAAGLSDEAFEALMDEVAREPERAFEDLRALLFDATGALVACRSVADALVALEPFEEHRFQPLLHRYELSNWVLYARAYAGAATSSDERAREVDAALREPGVVSLDWLTAKWVTPGLGSSTDDTSPA